MQSTGSRLSVPLGHVLTHAGTTQDALGMCNARRNRKKRVIRQRDLVSITSNTVGVDAEVPCH
jgi:hypothetical protein